MNKNTFISLFSGCGGSSLGYKQADLEELLAIDFYKEVIQTFKENFSNTNVWQKDICKVNLEDILKECKIKKGEFFLLDGSPPCQIFS